MPFINVDGNKIEYSIKKGRSRRYIYIRAKDDTVEVVLPDEKWLYFVDPEDIEKVYRKAAEKKRLITEEGFYFDGRWVSGKDRDAEKLLRIESRTYLESAIRELSSLMEVQPKSFKIVDTKYWGSCSAKGVLSFNFRIACLPENMKEYLVVHELAHLKHFNHSKAFWSDVEKLCPEYRKIRKALKSFAL